MNTVIGQVFLTIAGVIVLAWVGLPFIVRKMPKRQKMVDVEAAKYTIFAPGDIVELTEGAREVLGLELIEKFGSGPFVVVAIGEADEVLRHMHPQFLFLRGKRDQMMIREGKGNVRFCGAFLRKRRKTKTAFFPTKNGKLSRVAG